MLPDGFEVVQPNNVPNGFEVVSEQDRGVIQQAGLDTMNALKYNGSKTGALINAGLANVNEALGLNSDLFRDNQAYYQDAASNADTALNRTYGDGFMKTAVKEVGNPINYIGGGMKSLGGIVAGDTAGEIATHGDRSGVSLQDASRVADNTSIGLVGGKAIDSLMNLQPKRLLLGDDIKTPTEIQDIKALADKHGIKLTPASTTGSANLARLEHSINDGVAGGLGMRQALNAEKQTTDNAITSTLENMGANGSNVIAGENLRASTQSVIESEKQYFYDSFSQLFARYGDSPIFSIRGVKAEAQKLVTQAETIPLIKNSAAYRDSKAILESADDLSWSDWSKLRTHLGGLTQDATVSGKASTGAYKNMYSKLEGDLVASVGRTGDTDTLKQYKTIIDEYKQFKQDFEGKGSGAQFIRSLVEDRVRPEAVGSMINNSSLKAKGALSAGGVDVSSGIPIAKKASATDVLQSSMSKLEDGLHLPAFLKYSDRDGFKTIAEAPNRQVRRNTITDGGVDDIVPTRGTVPRSTNDAEYISDLQTLTKAIVKKDNYKNTSKTAQYNMLNALKAMSPLEAAKFIIKDVGISLAYKSEMFQKWLEKGILSPSDYKLLMKKNRPRTSAIRNTAVTTLLNSNPDTSSKTKLGL